MNALFEARWIFAALFAALAAATSVGCILARRHPSSAAINNLNARTRSWWIMIVIGGVALAAGPPGILALFALLSLLALREFLADPKWKTPLVLAVAIQYALIAAGSDWFLLWIPACAFIACRARPDTAWGLLICVYGVSHAPALLLRHNALLVLFVVLIAQSSDVFQYLFGRLLGSHPVAPRISPSKTVEGLVGGLAAAALLGWCLTSIVPFSAPQAACLAFAIAAAGFLGGLLLSAVKRRRGIKDWGGLIAGHGGVLDRLDSLYLSAPLFFHLTGWLLA